MKKLCLIVGAVLAALLCAICIDLFAKYRIDKNIDKAKYYNNINLRNSCDYALNGVIDEDSIVVLGSSELPASDDPTDAYPPVLFNKGHSDFNMILMGSGHIQSIPHTVNIGALQNNIKNKKVVLIVSPQWFTKGGLSPSAFASRFSETNYIEFLKNDSISKATRKAVAQRVNALLTSDPTTLDRVKNYEDVYLDHSLNLFKRIEAGTYGIFRNAKVRFELADNLEDMNVEYNDGYVKAEEIDFNELLSSADMVGKNACTTNDYGIEDKYYGQYIEKQYPTLKNSYANASFSASVEYDDLRLFLDVCKQTGIEPMIVSVPVNGRWYDYGAHSKADRNTYYRNIRNICAEYNVKLADFSDKEYELYFLKDIMHLGWKGWVYLDKAVYSFYKGEDISTDTPKTELEINRSAASNSNGAVSRNQSLDFTGSDDSKPFTAVKVTTSASEVVIDSTTKAEHRSSVFLNSKGNGYKSIRIAADSESGGEYTEFQVYMKENTAYSIEYTVDSYTAKSISVSGIKLYEMKY